MSWRLPHDWKVPGKITKDCLPKEEFYLAMKRRGTLYSHTGPGFRLVQPHLTNTRVAIDIGAHIGTTAVRYAKHFDIVHALEPVYYDLLGDNTKHLDNIVIHPFAASNTVGTLIMRKSRRNSGATVVKTKSNEQMLKTTKGRYKRFSQEDLPVNCIPVDSLNLTNVDFVKMDTEEYVLPVLQGMVNTLKNSNPILMIELKERMADHQQCINFIDCLGYHQFDQYKVDWLFKRD